MNFFVKVTTGIAVANLLVGSTTASPEDPLFVPTTILEQFKNSRYVKDDYDLPLQSIGDNIIELPDESGTTFDITTANIPVELFSGECFLDGRQSTCQDPSTFENEDHTLSKSMNVDGQTIDNIIARGGSDDMSLYMFEHVYELVYTYVPPEAIDMEKMPPMEWSNAMVNSDGISTGGDDDDDTSRILLRLKPNDDETDFVDALERQVQQEHMKNLNRDLQATCTDPNDRIIDVALAYDEGFCSEHGGTAASAENRIAQIVEGVRMKYQAPILCMTVRVSYLEGFCDQATDPYVVGGVNNFAEESGCNAADFSAGPGRIQSFTNFWNTNRPVASFPRDTAHLLTGYDFNEGNIAGCATLINLCTPFAYGVNRLTRRPGATFPMTLTTQIGILAHEIGHNVDGRHETADDDSIMCGSGSCSFPADATWTQDNADRMQAYYDSLSQACRDTSTTEAPTQSNVPSSSPTGLEPTLSGVPSSSPTDTPSDVPTAQPSLSSAPSASPSGIPSNQASLGPSESSKPSDSPTMEPSLSLHPSTEPTGEPSLSMEPSSEPSTSPSLSNVPTIDGTSSPTRSLNPSSTPSSIPTVSPSISSKPSWMPSRSPSLSNQPSNGPTTSPSLSLKPSIHPTFSPSTSLVPSGVPTTQPSLSLAPSRSPSENPSTSNVPSEQPSARPSTVPTDQPSILPSLRPSLSMMPSMDPSGTPSWMPSSTPSSSPSTSGGGACTAQPEFTCGYKYDGNEVYSGYFTACTKDWRGRRRTYCFHKDALGDAGVGDRIFPYNGNQRKYMDILNCGCCPDHEDRYDVCDYTPIPCDIQKYHCYLDRYGTVGVQYCARDAYGHNFCECGDPFHNIEEHYGDTIYGCGHDCEPIDGATPSPSSAPSESNEPTEDESSRDDNVCVHDWSRNECGHNAFPLCLRKDKPKRGKPYHYRQYCVSNHYDGMFRPGDWVSNNMQVASCGCCSEDGDVEEDIDNGFKLLIAGNARGSQCA